MALHFREDKATQAAARLLQRAGGRLNLMSLVKMLYFADREALVRYGRPITFDAFVSMPHGPVVSRVYNLINEEPDPDGRRYWHQFISERRRYDLDLLADPGLGALSDAEVAVLDRIWDDYGHMSQYALRDLSHELPEWVDPLGSSLPIRVREILESEGYTREEATEIERELEHVSSVADELAG